MAVLNQANRSGEKDRQRANAKNKKAVRSIIPGKNPKTQRDVQSDRLCLATQGRKHLPALMSKLFSNYFHVLQFRPNGGRGQLMRGKLEESINPGDFSPSS